MGPASNTYANINVLVPCCSSVIYSSLFTRGSRMLQHLIHVIGEAQIIKWYEEILCCGWSIAM